jgi:hypothetical protein
MTENDKEKEFVVKDKRVLNEEGADDAGEAADAKKPETPGGSKGAESETLLPEINFATFIASLNASALVNLGIIADPASGTKEKNLPIAKQTIDIMSMLQEKTKGNLTVDEESILKSILYDLKMMYVREKR